MSLTSRLSRLLGGLAVGAVVTLGAVSAKAALIVEGITYNLYEETTGSALTHKFTLTIDGVNGVNDTRGGRSGIGAIAFNQPAKFSSATPITAGFVSLGGGLDADGCNGKGNFFCFDANPNPPTAPALAANTSISFVFTVTLASGGVFTGYAPDFKIDWIGSANNYDLVSQILRPTQGAPNPTPTPAPEPMSLALLGVGLAGLGLAMRRRRAA